MKVVPVCFSYSFENTLQVLRNSAYEDDSDNGEKDQDLRLCFGCISLLASSVGLFVRVVCFVERFFLLLQVEKVFKLRLSVCINPKLQVHTHTVLCPLSVCCHAFHLFHVSLNVNFRAGHCHTQLTIPFHLPTASFQSGEHVLCCLQHIYLCFEKAIDTVEFVHDVRKLKRKFDFLTLRVWITDIL